MITPSFLKIQKENSQPKILIVGDKKFIGFFLQEFLLRQGCEAIFDPNEAKFCQYIFCLNEPDKEKIKKLIDIVQKTGAKFLLAIGKNFTGTRLMEKNFQEKKIDYRVVYWGDIYGPRMDYQEYQKLLQKIKTDEALPVFVADVIYGLVKAMFSSATSGKTFSLIDQSRELKWQSETSLKDGLEQTEKWFGEMNKKKRWDVRSGKLDNEAGSGKSRNLEISLQKSKKSHFLLLISIFFLIILLFFPLISLTFHGFWGLRNLKKAQETALRADFKQTTKLAKSSGRSFTIVKTRLGQILPLFHFLGQEKRAGQIEKLVDLGEKATSGLTHLSLAANQASQLAKFVFQDQSLDVSQTVVGISLELDRAYEDLSLAEVELKNQAARRWLPLRFGGTIAEIKDLLLKTKTGIKLIPEFIGFNGRKVYLILFQNNMEIRPTGGFIGSYGLITFDQGKLIDFEVNDVYVADGQFKGHVEPPSELRKYLGEANWYLRDSNWSPDFPTSALRAEWFFQKETGRPIDGVIGVNLSLIQNILKQLGEVELPDFQEKINDRNLFERAEYYSESGFFPGSTQKKDFLASLARTIFEKIKGSTSKLQLSLAKAFYTSLKEKDILVYLHSPQERKIVAALNWDGGIKSTKGDYLMIVEANLGVNKANYFIQRNLTHEVKIDQDGMIQEKLQIRYQNQSQSEIFPAGRYKNYLRIYVPEGSTPLDLVIKNPTSGEKVEGVDLTEGSEQGKAVFGFLVEVPIKEQRVVELTYQLPGKIDFGKLTQYTLLVQKQSGIKDKAFNFWLTVPQKVTFVDAKPKSTRSVNTLLFSPEFNQDIVFEIGLW